MQLEWFCRQFRPDEIGGFIHSGFLVMLTEGSGLVSDFNDRTNRCCYRVINIHFDVRRFY